MAKKALSPEQKLMKAIYGKPIEDMTPEEKREAYEKAKRIEERLKFPNKTISFDIPVDEKAVDFFKRMQEEMMDNEKAIRARIKQLFDEFIGVEDRTTAQKAYQQVMTVFGIGYQLGWNDRKAVEDSTKAN